MLLLLLPAIKPLPADPLLCAAEFSVAVAHAAAFEEPEWIVRASPKLLRRVLKRRESGINEEAAVDILVSRLVGCTLPLALALIKSNAFMFSLFGVMVAADSCVCITTLCMRMFGGGGGGGGGEGGASPSFD